MTSRPLRKAVQIWQRSPPNASCWAATNLCGALCPACTQPPRNQAQPTFPGSLLLRLGHIRHLHPHRESAWKPLQSLQTHTGERSNERSERHHHSSPDTTLSRSLLLVSLYLPSSSSSCPPCPCWSAPTFLSAVPTVFCVKCVNKGAGQYYSSCSFYQAKPWYWMETGRFARRGGAAVLSDGVSSSTSRRGTAVPATLGLLKEISQLDGLQEALVPRGRSAALVPLQPCSALARLSLFRPRYFLIPRVLPAPAIPSCRIAGSFQRRSERAPWISYWLGKRAIEGG